MEASTYAWAVILTFFLLYATIQLRKCFLQMLSSGERTTTSTNRLSSSSVYTIENDSVVRTFRTDRDLSGCANGPNKEEDDLPTYEQVIASDKLNPINCLSASPEMCSTSSDVSIGTQSSNVIASNATTDR